MISSEFSWTEDESEQKKIRINRPLFIVYVAQKIKSDYLC